MLLKRIWDTPEGWEPEYEGLAAFEAALDQMDPQILTPEMRASMLAHFKAGATMINPPQLKGVDVEHTGGRPEQNFSRELVEKGVDNGMFSLSRGRLTLHTQTQGDLVYTVKRTPGYYCCHCDERLEDDPTGVLSKAHIARLHAGASSPDPSNPLGYRLTHAYECVLDEQHHAEFNVAAMQDKRRAEMRGEQGHPNGQAMTQRQAREAAQQGLASAPQMPSSESAGD